MKRLMSRGRRFTSMAEWPCFEPLSGIARRRMAVSKGAIEACSQDYGSMVTEPHRMGKERHCRMLKPCILAVRSLRRSLGPEGQIKTMRDCWGKSNDHDGAYRHGVDC